MKRTFPPWLVADRITFELPGVPARNSTSTPSPKVSKSMLYCDEHAMALPVSPMALHKIARIFFMICHPMHKKIVVIYQSKAQKNFLQLALSSG